MSQKESHKLHEKSRNLHRDGYWLALKGLDKIKIKILGSNQLAFPAIAKDQDLRILDGAPTSEGCQNDRLTISMVQLQLCAPIVSTLLRVPSRLQSDGSTGIKAGL